MYSLVFDEFDDGSKCIYLYKMYSDKREGLETTWYPDGQKHKVRNYKDGLYNGLVITFHEDGSIWYRDTFKDGLRVRNISDV